MRAHLLAIYGFARLADDIGDEAEGDRLAQLDWLEAELHRAAEGRASHPLLQRLSPTLIDLGLPLDPFVDLIEANRMDQRVRVYETFEDLARVLPAVGRPGGPPRAHGLRGRHAREDRVLSDDVCHRAAGGRAPPGRRRGRPAGPGLPSPGRPAGVAGSTSTSSAATQASPALRRLVAVEASRARRLLDSGPALAATLAWRPRLAVGAFTAGGQAALDAMVEQRFDVLGQALPTGSADASPCACWETWPRPASSEEGGVNHQEAYAECEAITRTGGQELRLRHPPASGTRAPGSLFGVRAGPADRRHR